MKHGTKLKKKIIKLHEYYGIEINRWIPDARNRYFKELFAILDKYDRIRY